MRKSPSPQKNTPTFVRTVGLSNQILGVQYETGNIFGYIWKTILVYRFVIKDKHDVGT
jgi:hypothetical protein